MQHTVCYIVYCSIVGFLPHPVLVIFCCRYVRFWDVFAPDSCVVQAAAIAGGLVCSYSPDSAVLAVGLVETNFHCIVSVKN